ncbi:sensor histidine kinase [Desulfoluna sp.]|uniref:sensor histidine kinase n=1 Tax=Desulfoluna sp. TaxID=2045199 RepID=UPI0026317F63|nr:sensor histidine kinase [Desulfoluna sp.]
MANKTHDRNIGRFILGNMTLVPLVPFLVLLVVGAILFSGAMEKSIMERLSQTARDHGAMVDTFLKERRSDLALLASVSSYEALSTSENLEVAFGHLKASSGAFMDLGVFDEAGVHVAYTGPYRLEGIDYQEEFWFRKTMATGSWISDVFSGFRKTPHVVVAVRVQGAGRPWVLRATIDTDLFQSLTSRVHIGVTGQAFLLNDEGIYQSLPASRGKLMEKDPDSDAYVTGDGWAGARVIACRDGVKRVFATTRLTEKAWRLVVVQNKHEAFESRLQIYLVIFAVMVAGGGALLAVGYGLTVRIVSRIRRSDDQAVHLEEQLYRAARLAELGEMAAGFAHEINNPLQVMQSELAYMGETIGDVERGEGDFEVVRESLDQMRLQIGRCSEITRSVLNFGRKSTSKDQDVAMGDFLSDVVKMVRKRAEVSGVILQTEIPENGALVWGDPSRLQQVFLNLINNALDAVDARHGSCGGLIQVSVREEPETVSIDVEDNGGGMNEETQAKIFSPFYTTKPPGSGTGLGLSVCFSIVESMGGHIDVTSTPGEGTLFTIVLPCQPPR